MLDLIRERFWAHARVVHRRGALGGARDRGGGFVGTLLGDVLYIWKRSFGVE